MKYKKQKLKGKVKCPCCNAFMGTNDYSSLKQSYDTLVEQRGAHYVTLKIAINYLNWACDFCLKRKSAIIAKPLVQNYYGYDLPYFMYFDKERKCQDCSKDFIFSKEEQKHWYETLKFYVSAQAIHCKDCRKDRRQLKAQNNRIMELTAKDTLSKEELLELSKIYTEIGAIEKANRYKNKAKKAT